MSAFDAVSGSYPTIRRGHRRGHEATRSAAWSPASWMVFLGIALLCATPLLGVIYVLAYIAGADRYMTGLIIAAVCAAPLGGLVSIVHAVHDRRCRDRAAELRETARRVEAQVRALTEAASDIRQTLAELEDLRSIKRAVMVAMDEQNRLYREELKGLRYEVSERLDLMQLTIDGANTAATVVARATGRPLVSVPPPQSRNGG